MALKIFADKEDKSPIDVVRFPTSIDAGSEGKLVVYLRNIGKNEYVKLQLVTDIGEGEVIITPKEIKSIKPNESIEILLIWRPSKDRVTPLSTRIRAVGFEVIKAE